MQPKREFRNLDRCRIDVHTEDIVAKNVCERLIDGAFNRALRTFHITGRRDPLSEKAPKGRDEESTRSAGWVNDPNGFQPLDIGTRGASRRSASLRIPIAA